MAQNEVAEAAGSCGHGGDDAACKCWGVYMANTDGTPRDICSRWAVLDGHSVRSGNYVASYRVALTQRRMYPYISYRVRRGATTCKDCDASPCDCGQPIWSWRFRSPQYPTGAWRGCHDEPKGERRGAIVGLHTQQDAPYGAERGPIQRITDPPYEFPATRKPSMGTCTFCHASVGPRDVCCEALRRYRMGNHTVRCRHDSSDPQCICWQMAYEGSSGVDVCTGFRGNFDTARSRVQMSVCGQSGRYFVFEMRSPAHFYDYSSKTWNVDPPNAAHTSSDTNSTRTRTHKCALEWCDAQASSMYCSERCADYSERRGKLVALMTDFEKRTESRRGGQLWAELAWVRQRTGNDLFDLQRAWQAVQHEAAVGDERFFKLLDDEDV